MADLSSTHYTKSDNSLIRIDIMANGHLHNALANLMWRDPTRVGEIEAMTAEVVKRAKAEDYAAMTTPELAVRAQQMLASPWLPALQAEGLMTRIHEMLSERGLK